MANPVPESDQSLADQVISNLTAVTENIPGIIYQFKVDTEGNWLFPYVSPSVKHFLGLDAEAIVADSSLLLNTVHPLDGELLATAVNESLEKQQPYDLVHRMVTVAGEVKWARTRSQPKRLADGSTLWTGLAIDITDQQHSQEAYRSLVENSWQGLLILQAGKLVFANQAVTNICGYSRAELSQMAWEELLTIVHAEDRDRLPDIQGELVSKEAAVVEVPLRIRRPDGDIRHLEAKISQDSYFGHPALQFVLQDVTDRRAAELAAREQQHLVSQITKLSPNKLYVIDLMTDQLIYANRQVEAFLDCTHEEMLASGIKLFTQRLHPDDRQKFKGANARWDDTADSDVLTREYRLQNRYGEYRWLRSHETIFKRDDGGRPIQILGTAVDITPNRVAQAALQQSEARHRTTLNSLPLIVLIHDQGIIQFINQVGAELLDGEAPADFLGESVFQFVHPDHHPVIKERMANLVAGEENKARDIKLVSKNGVEFFVSAQSRPQMVDGRHVGLVIATNVTERRHTEDQLRKQEARLKAIFENSQSGILVADDDGNYINVNQAAADMFGYSLEELLSMNVSQLLTTEKESAANQYQQFLAAGRETGEFRFIRADGEERVAHYNASRIAQDFNLSVVADITPQKTVERNLRQSEQRFRQLFSSMHLPTYAWQYVPGPTVDFILTDYNVAADKITQGGVKNFMGTKASEMYARQPQILADLRACYTQQKTISREMDYRYMATGDQRYLLVSYTYISKDLITVVTEDLTARKKAEEALRQSEARFRAIFDHAPIGITVATAAGEIIDTNPLMRQLLDYSADELTDLNITDIIAAESGPTGESDQAFGRAGRPSTANHENKFVRRDGATFWGQVQTSVVHNEDGEIELAIGMVQDITERRGAELSLRKLKQAIEHSPVSVIITDNEGTIEYVNPAFSQVTGYSAAEAVGQTPRILKSGEHAEEYYQELWQTLARGEQWRGEFHNRKKNGDLYWEQASIQGIWGENGRISHIVSIQEDVTERKRHEEERVRQERLAAVGQLAAGIAHDFNNIMAVISMYSELLMRSPRLSQNEISKLQTIHQQTLHAANLTKQILDFSRRSIRQPQPLELKSLLNEILKFTERTTPERIQFQFKWDEGPHMIQADPTQVQQIITNLTLNAQDAMPQGGKLTFNLSQLTLQETDPPPAPAMSAGQWVQLSVTDTGNGIDAKTLPRIFEPFFTTKEVGEGTGLGLAQVYGIVQQHNGFITASSQPGAGTTFTIYFPAITFETEPRDKPTRISPMGRGETILLVEDNETLLEAARLNLESINYRVLTAVNGADALNIYRQHANTISLVLTDVMMPVMDGINLVNALIKEVNPPPIIMMSGFPQKHELTPAARQRIVKWLQKPLDIQELGETLANILQA